MCDTADFNSHPRLSQTKRGDANTNTNPKPKAKFKINTFICKKKENLKNDQTINAMTCPILQVPILRQQSQIGESRISENLSDGSIKA